MKKNFSLSQGLVTWMGWMAPGGSVASGEGWVGYVPSVPLP